MGLIFLVSSRSTLPRVTNGAAETLVKKSAHMLEYAILVVLWRKPLSGQMGAGRSLLAAWLLAVLYAVSDEYHQTFVPGRQGRVFDVLVDAMGAMLAVLGMWWHSHATRRGRQDP